MCRCARSSTFQPHAALVGQDLILCLRKMASLHPFHLEIIAFADRPWHCRLKACCFIAVQEDSIRTPSIHKRTGCIAGNQNNRLSTRQSRRASSYSATHHASRSDGSRTAVHRQHSQCSQSQQSARRRRPEIKDRRQRARRPFDQRQRISSKGEQLIAAPRASALETTSLEAKNAPRALKREGYCDDAAWQQAGWQGRLALRLLKARKDEADFGAVAGSPRRLPYDELPVASWTTATRERPR